MKYDKPKNLKLLKQKLFRVLEKSNKPLNYKQISKKMKFNDKLFILDLLESLLKVKKIEVTENFKFFIKRKNEKTLSGFVVRQKNINFFQPEGSEDLLILENSKRNFFFDNDFINAKVYFKKNEPRADFINIIERTKKEFVGIVERGSSHCFVIPLDRKIKTDFYIDSKNSLNANNNDRVIFRIIDWPRGAKSPFAKITDIIGQKDNFKVEKKSILHKYEIKESFSTKALKELEEIKENISVAETKKRKDLRELNTFTIDPDDAKDFDDALSISKVDKKIYEIGVHIADVSHYIKSGSHLDKEALERGCSVYLEDQVIPMIPEKLSNKICSLRPNEDKLCLSVLLKISEDGVIKKSWVEKTIINSKYRLTYKEAQDIILGNSHKLNKEIKILNSIAQIFRKKRIKKGSVIIKQEETKIKFNKDNEPEKAIRKKTLLANQLVEEFMLIANKEVCKYFSKNRSTVFRIHDKPDLDKLKSFSLFLKNKNVKFDSSQKNLSKEINRVLGETSGDPDFDIINNMVLRSMSKAKYSTENIGHFGLGFKNYTHFTSPIRRYSDILVHRELDKKTEGIENLESICSNISKKEINAIKAEREYKNYLLLWMIRDKINEVCNGKITSVKEWGLYVKLNEFLCEGLVPISSLRKVGQFYFDEKKERIINKKTGKQYKIGQEVEVEIQKINLNYGELDLILI